MTAQTYRARCATCHEYKWPHLSDPPAADWRCALCRAIQGTRKPRKGVGGRPKKAP